MNRGAAVFEESDRNEADSSAEDEAEEETEREETTADGDETTGEGPQKGEAGKYVIEAPAEKPPGLTFDHYLAGGALGFSSAMFLAMGVMWLLLKADVAMTLILQLVISVAPNVVGGAISAFLVTRKSRMNYLKDGAKIGFAGFVITFIVTIVMGSSVGGVYILAGFLIGGCLGGLISKRIYKRY